MSVLGTIVTERTGSYVSSAVMENDEKASVEIQKEMTKRTETICLMRCIKSPPIFLIYKHLTLA